MLDTWCSPQSTMMATATGYCNWPSTYTYGWNSMAVGPKRNVIGELRDAFAKRHPEVHFGLYYSLFEWFNPIYFKDKESGFQQQ